MANAGGSPRFGIIFATAQEAGPLRACLSPFAAAENLSPGPFPAREGAPTSERAAHRPRHSPSHALTVPHTRNPTTSPSHRRSSFILYPSSFAVTVSVAGIGRTAARRVAMEMVETEGVDWLVSVGAAGGLREGLGIGAVVEGAEIVDENGMRWSALPLSGSDAVGNPRVVVYSSPVILQTPQQKRAARDRYQADVVEMEASAIAAVAAEKGVRFSCVKSISDTSADALPLDFNLFLAPSGSMRLPAIVLSTLAHPWLIPGLITLGSNSRFACRQLAEYLLMSLSGAETHSDLVAAGSAVTADNLAAPRSCKRPT